MIGAIIEDIIGSTYEFIKWHTFDETVPITIWTFLEGEDFDHLCCGD